MDTDIIKKSLIFAMIFTVLIGIARYLVHNFCNSDFGCLSMYILLMYPGLTVNGLLFNDKLTDFSLIALNFFVFFLFGFVLAFVFNLIRGSSASPAGSSERKSGFFGSGDTQRGKVEHRKDKIIIKK